MARLTFNFYSTCLLRTVNVQVILPIDKITAEGAPKDQKFKTLYLLHGLMGDSMDWISGTRIQRWASDKNLCVVMPSGENKFYIDQPGKEFEKFGEFIGKELVEITRKTFPLSDKREDTFIGGLSMGGYGAMRNGLKYAETFGYICAFSSALHTFEAPIDSEPRDLDLKLGCYGDIKKAYTTDFNPRVCFERIKGSTGESRQDRIPKIYMACGLQDTLLESNRSFCDFLVKGGADVTYVEEPGAHTWDFWDDQIKKALDWLPLGGRQRDFPAATSQSSDPLVKSPKG